MTLFVDIISDIPLLKLTVCLSNVDGFSSMRLLVGVKLEQNPKPIIKYT